MEDKEVEEEEGWNGVVREMPSSRPATPRKLLLPA